MRSKWIDKATGKVINLSNYSFSQMSGWGGYKLPPFTTTVTHPDRATASVMASSIQVSAIYAIESTTLAILEWTTGIDIGESPVSQAFKISGIPDGYYVAFDYLMSDGAGSTALFSTKNSGDGVYTAENIPPDAQFYRWTIKMNNDGFVSETTCDLKIEMLPAYPGALVSDGVDDYISEDGTLEEAVGTVLIHWKDIGLKNGHYLYHTSFEDTGRLYCYRHSDGPGMGAGIPAMAMTGKPIMYFTREPAVPEAPLNNRAGENNCPIFRLIFIKEQLDDTQLEFLMWKVSKEYRDWLKEKGYDYAIDEMLNN